MKKTVLGIILLAACGLIMTSCLSKDLSDAPDLVVFEMENFDEKTKLFVESDGWSNGAPFSSTWRKDNVSYENGEMGLTVNKEGDKYYSGEIKSKDTFLYGNFSAKIKPISEDGICTGFFVYTGESEGNPWNEIDVEFTGNDTTKVQFNYYNGDGNGHEKWYDLGFDASKEYHEYGFRWSETEIVWYVDDKPVHRVTGTLPSTESRIICNTWTGDDSTNMWMGELSSDFTSGTAYFDEINFGTLDGKPYTPTFIPDPDPETATYESLTDLNFNAGTSYTVNKDGENYNVTYSDIKQSYDNIYANVPGKAYKANAIKFKVKNNGTQTVSLRTKWNYWNKCKYSFT